MFIGDAQVTEACYSHCVAEGACAAVPPFEPDAWVRVHKAEAEAFCSWRGGRLPSLLELSRASKGDAPGTAMPAPYEALLACYPYFQKEGCDHLWDYASGATSDRWTLDVGPWGHRGLFGGGGDITRSRLFDETLCSFPRDSVDPVHLSTNDEDVTMLSPAYTLATNIAASADFSWQVTEAAAMNPIYTDVFRCAFDPVYEPAPEGEAEPSP